MPLTRGNRSAAPNAGDSQAAAPVENLSMSSDRAYPLTLLAALMLAAAIATAFVGHAHGHEGRSGATPIAATR